MLSVEAKLRSLLEVAQFVLDDLPIGILVLSPTGRVLWFNHEAEIVCAIWNRTPLRADALPLSRSDFAVPPVLWTECQVLGANWGKGDEIRRLASEPDRNLSAMIRLLPPSGKGKRPGYYLQLDYRRPRGDRDRPVSAAALQMLSRLSFREREVAMRVREGMTTRDIAAALRRSPLTIKTQLAGIFRKLNVRRRTQVAALLNR